MKGEITLRELAKLSNLSVNTISRALNDRAGVHPETRRRIKHLAAEHGYRPNMMARSMRGVNNNLIGTLVGDITDNFFVQLLAGVEEEVDAEAMPIIIGDTGESKRKQAERLDLLLSYGCKNIIITPVDDDMAFIEKLKRERIHFVIADRTIPEARDCHQVSINNRMDAYRATEYLIQCGHRRIAILNQRSNISTETDRTLGYRQALAAHDIDANPAYELHCHDAAHVVRAINELLSAPGRPTAVFLAKDTLALSAVSAIYEMGFSIPSDLSVVIYGSPEWSQALRPHFTCMRRAVRDIGRMSARILIDRLNGNGASAPINLSFDSSLIVRDSVRLI